MAYPRRPTCLPDAAACLPLAEGHTVRPSPDRDPPDPSPVTARADAQASRTLRHRGNEARPGTGSPISQNHGRKINDSVHVEGR